MSAVNATSFLAIAVIVSLLSVPTWAQPDLSANSVFGPGSVQAGASMSFSRDISNIGTPFLGSFVYDIRLSVNTTISVSDPLVATITSSNLGFATGNATIPSGLAPGNYFVALIVQPLATEFNTSNNVVVSAGTVTVLAGVPDLAAVAIDGPTTAATSSTISVSRNISSVGGPLTAGALLYQVRLSQDTTITSQDPLLLQIGSTTLGQLNVNVTIPGGTPAGPYYLGLVVATYPGETNLANNIVVSTTTIDVVDTSPVLTSANPTIGALSGGDTITLSGTGFVEPMAVSIGGSLATMVSVTSSTAATCVTPMAPGGTPGQVDITVSTSLGSFLLVDGFRYGSPFPGSGEDLELTIGVNGTPTGDPFKTALPGDLITMHFTSPGGTFDGWGAVLIGQLYATGGPGPFAIPGFPEVQVDTSGAIVILDGNGPSPFGPIVYNPAGITIPFLYPGGLSGMTGIAQAFCVTPIAANGLFATSDALTVTYP